MYGIRGVEEVVQDSPHYYDPKDITIGHIGVDSTDIGLMIPVLKNRTEIVILVDDRKEQDTHTITNAKFLLTPDIDYIATNKPKRKGWERPYKYHR